MIEEEKIFFFGELLQKNFIISLCDQFIEQGGIRTLLIEVDFLFVDIALDIPLHRAGGRVITPVIINDERQGNKPACNYQEVAVLINKT